MNAAGPWDVRHARFGRGRVVAGHGTDTWLVAFEDGTERRLRADRLESI